MINKPGISYISAFIGCFIFFLQVSGFIFQPFSCASEYPQWWTERGVISTAPGVVTNDYAAVNAGQLKWFATNAYDELESTIGAGPEVTALVSGFSLANNYQAINRGQLKHVASIFWNRLIEVGYTNALPWTDDPASSDYALANIGQLKYLFSFDLRDMDFDADIDGDGLPDWWEMRIINANDNDNIEIVEHIRPQDDFDGDGVSNQDEKNMGTDAANPLAKPPVVEFDASASVFLETSGYIHTYLSINPAPTEIVRATVSYVGGTATPDSDFLYYQTSVTFAPSVLGGDADIMIYTDDEREPPETVRLMITGISGPALIGAKRNHVVEIRDSFMDSDEDGLPDSWEIKFWGNLDQTAEDDPDGDGWNNLKEYCLGSDPTAGWVLDSENLTELNVFTPLRD